MSLNVEQAKDKMEGVFEHLSQELKKIRTGRANPGMLDGIVVRAYGQEVPLKHLANIVAADAQLLQITPFDPNNLGVISAAISESSLGLNPSDDGHVVRIPVPALNEERRLELVKSLNQVAEASRVALRNIRHDVLDKAKDQKKTGELSENDLVRVEKDMAELMDDSNKKIDEAFEKKQSEIMTV